MLKKILLPTVVISGAVFIILATLLALQGAKRVEVQVENQQVFYGDLKDIITPPVGALLSLGVGLTSAVLVAWKQSAQKSSELENQASHLRQLISEKEAMIEELKSSPTSARMAQLNWFLNEAETTVSGKQFTNTTEQVLTSEADTLPVPHQMATLTMTNQPTWVQMSGDITEPLVVQSAALVEEKRKTKQLNPQTAAAVFPSTQSVMGLNHRHTGEY
ncbi:hypothetical protein [Calothrix sp. 336/3]|uniref:hypothetical protein n=1 Tax=Calothrix sp. 336/3 TaxID=1337936 RepID=UPI0004E363CB|nr:hypothetical protein [Calothrix sp. 336/3]AKG21968.1 hypothetical protein IJ00_12490 [Calothrix sp. 336/3]